MLVVEDLHKSFAYQVANNKDATEARLKVLRGVSFSIADGETAAINGVSGAGKSTLLNIIGGLDSADSGRVCIDDFEVTKETSSRETSNRLTEFRQASIGFVFQFHHLLPDLTARENIALPLLINRLPRREALARADALLELIDLTNRSAHLPAELSGGERGRISVARALITNPKLVLADEPTGNLDAANAALVTKLLIRLAHARKASVLIATHNQELAQSCHQQLYLRNGRIAFN